MITIYARKEPTLDAVALQHGLKKKDVVFYMDEACTRRFCCWSWYNNPPRRNTKTVVLNCYNWAVKWLTDKAEPQTQPSLGG